MKWEEPTPFMLEISILKFSGYLKKAQVYNGQSLTIITKKMRTPVEADTCLKQTSYFTFFLKWHSARLS